MVLITYELINKDSVIGFDKIELIAIADGQFWFKCHYEVVFKGKTSKEIDLIPFNVEDLSIIGKDYKVVS